MKRRPHWPALVAAAALVTGAHPGTAAAAISPSGIAGVEIGMTESEVREEIGNPSRVTGPARDGTTQLDYTRRRLDVLLRGDSAIRVRTTSRAQRYRGVGPGVGERTMRRRLRGERCSTARGTRVCYFAVGKTVLSFSCRRGKVILAEVARAEM